MPTFLSFFIPSLLSSISDFPPPSLPIFIPFFHSFPHIPSIFFFISLFSLSSLSFVFPFSLFLIFFLLPCLSFLLPLTPFCHPRSNSLRSLISFFFLSSLRSLLAVFFFALPTISFFLLLHTFYVLLFFIPSLLYSSFVSFVLSSPLSLLLLSVPAYIL